MRSRPIDPTVQVWIFLALFAGFAIKVPLFPLHTWLPLAHVEAPTAGSVILAGVLLKVGTYGFARFNLPMLPDATATLMPWLLWMSLAGIIYGALVALAQRDIKRLIAYSSVSHLGFCMLGLFAAQPAGRPGRRAANDQPRPVDRRAVRRGGHALRALPHAADRRLRRAGPAAARAGLLHARADPGQHRPAGPERLRRRVPHPAGHVRTGLGQAPADHWLQLRSIAVLAVSGVVLGAWYMLWMYQRVFFGPLREPAHRAGRPPPRDLSGARSAAWRRWWCSFSGSACSRGSSSIAWRRRWMPWWPRRCERSANMI